MPSYRYSRRFGPRPPCFARATVLHLGAAGDAPLVLVGGTASIRGEDSVHVGNVRGQVLETSLGSVPVYNNVREGLEAGHSFNCGVVYLPPSAARDGVA